MLELTVIKHHHANFQTPSCSEACIYRTKIREIMSPVSTSDVGPFPMNMAMAETYLIQMLSKASY